MSGFRKFTTGSGDGKFQIAPMIDIVFLLLIFFICVTTFDHLETTEEIHLANASDSKDMSKVPGTIIVNINTRGRIDISSVSFSLKELDSFLRAISVKHGTDIPIIIRADKKVRYENVLTVMKICSDIGIWDVSFATQKQE